MLIRSLAPALALMPALMLTIPLTAAAAGTSILFIGNSFDFASGSAVRYYRADTVTDLNGGGIGGVPALFKSFTMQAGLGYDVALETEPGVGLDWHLAHKLGVIGRRPWDIVVMHGYSLLDQAKPGNPALLIATVRQMSEFLHQENPRVDVRLIATWPRADQLYDPKGAWYGKSVEIMAQELRAGYDQAAAASPGIRGVIPVGEAWIRAMHEGIADSNPYDGIEAGKLNLWTYDSYHGSTYGYYLDALMLFGSVTGRDPRSLGANECSGFELGLSPVQVGALEQVASEALNAAVAPSSAAPIPDRQRKPVPCGRAH
jgi:hypothetical protein